MILRLFYRLLYWNLLDFIPDKWMISLQFRLFLGRNMNWKRPETYNEKLNWLKLYDNKAESYSKYVDKYEVRKFIADTIGDVYLVPLLGVWNKFEDIDFALLPDKFVLKCNHGSHCSVICTDKAKFNYIHAEKSFKSWMKSNWYCFYREKPYKNITPCIIAETFIGNDNNDVPEDYKVFCTDGIPQIIRVDVNRYKSDVTYNYYTTDWHRSELQFTPVSEIDTPRPDCLEQMLELSSRIAFGLKHVRVDWYVVDGNLYFGEMTFYNAAGYDTDFIKYNDDLRFGRLLNL